MKSNINEYLLYFFIIGVVIVITYHFQNSKNVFFTHVYLMNLERRPDRLNNFLSNYNNSDMKDIPITKFNAIDGSKLNISTVPLTNLAQLEMKQLETTGFRYKHYQLTKGAIGCYLSHVKIWENIIKTKQDKVLIFEDDARIPPNMLHAMNKIMKDIPEDWDIVLLGKYCNECVDKGKYYKINRFILLHSYLISRKGVEKIINADSLFPISQQLDAYLSEISDMLNIYAPKVDIIRQGNSRTDIQAPIIKSVHNHDRMLLENK